MFTEPICLVTSRGSGSGTVHQTFGPSFVTNNSFSVVPKEKWLGRHFLRFSLLNADILRFVTGSAQPQLTVTSFSSLCLLQPTRQVLERFHQLVDPLWLMGATKASESETLAALRDTLLPKLLSGDIRVKDAEKTVEALV